MFAKSVNSALSFTTRQQYFFSQKIMCLFGAPGVGKGTYAKILKNDLGFNHISTGDEIRAILKGNVPDTFDKNLIEEVRSVVTSGGLVSDEIVVNILKEKLKEPASQKGVILDGVPRTLGQLALQDQAGIPTHLVINLFLNQSVLLEKLTARRVCESCGENYNICHIDRDGYLMEPLNPSKPGICDKCGGNLGIRADDREDVISNRMEEYEEKTAPLLKAYQDRGIVLDFEPKKGKKSYPELYKLISDKLATL